MKATDTIEKKGMKSMVLHMKLAMKAMKIQPSYLHYVAKGDLSLQMDNTNVERKGELIYEIMCPGTKCVELMDTE